MSQIELQPTTTALWHALVNEAELAADQPLDTELESYLVYLLMRYTDRPEIARQVMALDFLASQLASGQLREDRLRDVADACLLYSGLYPQRAERRRVRASYYVDLGRSAYMQLSGITLQQIATLYNRLSDSFVQLMDVLSAIRRFHRKPDRYEVIHLHELWQDTGSRQAWRDLQSQAIPVRGNDRKQH